MGRQCYWGNGGRRGRHGVKNGGDEIYGLELDLWGPKVHGVLYNHLGFPLSVLSLLCIPMSCQM